MTQTFSHGEPNLVNDPIDNTSDTSLSLPETLSLPSIPSVTVQTPSTTSPTNIPSHLDDRYRELKGINTHLRLVGNSLVAPLPF